MQWPCHDPVGGDNRRILKEIVGFCGLSLSHRQALDRFVATTIHGRPRNIVATFESFDR